MPQYKNILIALDGQMAPEVMGRVQGIFRTIFKNSEDKLQVGRLDFVDSKEDIERLINGISYDVLLCTERIRGVNIGAGSIKQWRTRNHLLEIILFVGKSKKGGEKVRSLYKDGYYNAVYDADLQHRSGMIIDLILSGRTAEDALSYYGLEDVFAAEEVLGGKSADETVVETVVTEQPIEEFRNVVVEEVVSENVGIVEETSDEVMVSEAVESVVEEPVYVEAETNQIIAEKTFEENTVVEDTACGVMYGDDEIVEEVVSYEGDNVVPSREYWTTDGVSVSDVEGQEDLERPADEEQYIEYKKYSNEVSVLQRKAIDAGSLGGEMAVMVRGRISSVVTDTVLVIECPNGGLLKNKNLIEGRVITLLM